jgi:hypothetical protein
MAKNMQFDSQDRRALQALDDDFVISADGETATVAGEMSVVVIRPAVDGVGQIWLTLRFPSGETLDVRIARTQLLHELDVDADD